MASKNKKPKLSPSSKPRNLGHYFEDNLGAYMLYRSVLPDGPDQFPPIITLETATYSYTNSIKCGRSM